MKFDSYAKVVEAIEQLKEKQYKFTAAMDIYLTFNFGSKHVEKAKKQISFSILFPSRAGNDRKVMVFSENITIKDAVLHPVGLGKIKKLPFEILITKTSDMNKLTPILKTLGQKKITPNVDNGTLVNTDDQITSRYNEFISGKRRIVKINVGAHISTLYASVGTIESSKEEIIENIKTLMEMLNSKLMSIVKKTVIIRSMYIGTTMSESKQILPEDN